MKTQAILTSQSDNLPTNRNRVRFHPPGVLRGGSLACVIALGLSLSAFLQQPAAAATQYYKSTTAANAWTGNFWGSSASGPFTSAWVSGSDANFVDNGGTALALTGATTAFASVTANENVNVTATGTLGTGGTVASVTVASGKTLNFGSQALSTAAGTGFTKNGAGIWSLNGSAFTGGFTINAGTVAVGGVNAMGAGALTINGGTVRSTSGTARDLTGKYTSITLGGDFTLGDATQNGGLTFNHTTAAVPVSLGAASRTITVNSDVTIGAFTVISGNAGVGITKDGAGTLNLAGTNTFTGALTIKNGTVNGQNNINSLGLGGVTLGGSGSAGATLTGGKDFSTTVNVTVNAPSSGSCIISANGVGSGMAVGSITLNSADVTVQTFAAGTTGATTVKGGVTGTGNLILNNLNSGASPTGRPILSTATVNHTGAITNQGNGTTTTLISSVIGANVTRVVQNSSTARLELGGANLYTGPTIINLGTLVLGNANAASKSSSVTVASGAALALTNSSSTVSNLTFAGTGTLSFDVAGGYSLTVNGTDGVTNSGAASSVTINITGSAPANGTYTLISYSGALQGSGFSAYVLGTTPAGKSYALNDSGSAVELVVTSPYNWTGAQSTEWSTTTIAGSKNWTLGGSPADYTDGQVAVFDDTTTSNTVDISVADVTPSSVSFNNSTRAYTLQGSKAIAGTTSLTKTGSQTLTILNTNTYTGGTTISAGTLQLGDGTSGNDGTIASSPTIANSGSLVYNLFGTNSYGGVISGTGSVTKSGNGTQTLTGTNTYTGATTVNVGTLEIGGAGRLGSSGTYAGAITVASGATSAFNSTQNGTFSGAVTGSGTLLKANTQTLILNNSGNAISTIRVHAGFLAFDAGLNAGCSGAAGTTLYLGDTTGSADATISFFGGNDRTLTTKTAYIVQGGSSGTKTIRNAANAQAYTDNTPFTLNDNLTITNITGSTFLFGGIIGGSGGINKTGSGQLTLSGANTFNGGVTIKSGTVESKTTQFTLGTGTVVMGGAGSSGATYITGQGNTNAFTINAPDSGTNIIGANGAGSGFTMTGPVTMNGDLMVQSYFSSSLQSSRARPTFNGGITGTGNLILDNLSGGTNTITLGGNPINHVGSITAQGGSLGSNIINAVIGANVTGVTQNSATSILILSAANTYAGNTTINAGTLALIGSGSIANSPTISVGSGAVLDVSGVAGGFSLAAAQTLSGNGTVIGASTLNGTVSPGESIGTLTFSTAPTMAGTTLMEINRNGGSPLADKLDCTGGVTLAGALVVTNIGTAAQNGDTFDLFDGSVTGAFSSVTVPTGGLNHWKTNNLVVDGTITFTNNNPVAQNITAGAVLGGSVTLPVIGGKHGATDADADTMTLTSVGTPTSGSASFAGNNVTYDATGSTGTNTFTYTVNDAFGGSDTKTVTVIVTSPLGYNQVSAGVDGGNAVLSYLGIPGTNYALEITHDLPATNWAPVITNPASANGFLYFTNPISLSPTNDYYRTRFVP